MVSQLQHGHSQCAQFRGVLPQSLCVPGVVLVRGVSIIIASRKLEGHYTTPPGWRFVLFTVGGVIIVLGEYENEE